MAIIKLASNNNGTTDETKRFPRRRKPKLHYYNPSIAKEINPKQPDVTAATLLTNLAFWQNNFYPSTLINNRRHSFRSLSQMATDCPYLSEEAIHKAIKRLEAALGNEFLVNRQKKVLYFSIGETTWNKLQVTKRSRKDKEDDTTKKFSFLPADAIMTGSIRSAVLLANLRHQVDNFRNPCVDERGNRYGELSPSKLAPILQFSTDTIARSLNEMCKKRQLIRHATKGSFFRFPNASDALPSFEGGAEVHAKAAEVQITSAEVNEPPAKVHSQPAEVHRPPPSNHAQSAELQQSAWVGFPGCINECGNISGNESLKEIIKDSIYAGRTSPPCVPLIVSEGLTHLMNSAEVKLAKMHSDHGSTKVRASVHQDELPYDVIDPYELAYEVVSERERTFQSELDEGIELLKYFFKDFGQVVTADDEAKFRRFLTDNPKVDAMTLFELYGKVVHPPLVFTSKKDQESHPTGLLTKVKTPTQFLKYLPQLLVLLNWDGDEESSWSWVEEPFKDLNYAYLGEAPNSSIVCLDDGSVPSVVIED